MVVGNQGENVGRLRCSRMKGRSVGAAVQEMVVGPQDCPVASS